MKTIDEVILHGVPLKEILEKHNKWINNEPDGKCANLSYCELKYVDLSGVNLKGANLQCVRLYHINFSNANLSAANLSTAFIRNCSFESANLSLANFDYAKIQYTNFKGANISLAKLKNTLFNKTILRNANLEYSYCFSTDFAECILENANLDHTTCFGANFRDANFKNISINDVDFRRAYLDNITNFNNADGIINIPITCPTEGAFIAWKIVNEYATVEVTNSGYTKKIQNSYLVKLQIPASAKRSSSTSRKCRASKAKVLGIYDLDGKRLKLDHIVNIVEVDDKEVELDYIVGQMVYPDSFDDNRWNQCSHGIHFFLSRQEAIDYSIERR